MTLRHASFFSGVGGLDLGFERAGIETVSMCEIEPYASAVLASRWPEISNLGDIVELARKELGNGEKGDHQFPTEVQQAADTFQRSGRSADHQGGPTSGDDWRTADIWSGGFPCQDLSIAGSRKGFGGERSVLAFTFLNLVERYRPRWVVLENVPGIFTSNAGRDFLRLISEMDKLGYGISWRTLDARYFGVPQRRRRVFIVGSLGTDRASEVLLECEGGCGHSQASKSSWQESSKGSQPGAHVAGAILSRYHKGASSTVEDGQLVLSVAGAATYASGDGETHGMAGWMDNSNFSAMGAAIPKERATHLVSAYGISGEANLLPEQLDGHRYRCCGNGVVSNVAEWIGRRLVAADARA